MARVTTCTYDLYLYLLQVLKMTRVLEVLHEYVNQCDSDFGEERTILPMSRAFRGVQVNLTVRFPNQGRQIDDVELWTHTNDTLAALRRQILEKCVEKFD